MSELQFQVDPAQVASILDRVSDASPENIHEVWQRFNRQQWPALFQMIDLAADVGQLGRVRTLVQRWGDAWPEFFAVANHLLALQILVDHPIVPDNALTATVLGERDLTLAADQLHSHGCTHIDFFLNSDQRTRLDATVSELARSHAGRWQQPSPAEAPELFQLIESGLNSQSFRELTELDFSRDEYSLTLSLQALDKKGIGWHRDLYWPREWLGDDVLALFYAVGDEPDGKGGEFLYYLPDSNQIVSMHRRRHQATILSNGKGRDQRILHAVAEFRTLDSERHLVILQCRRAK